MMHKPTYATAVPLTAHYGGGMPEQTSTQRIATAPGIEVVVTTHAGVTEGLPVLLLHGLSQQRHFWDPVVRRLRARPVAAMDQRGHGDTGTPLASDFSVAACAADALAVIDRLGWARAVVVGHSWGASVALAAAAASGDRVAAAVLVDGGLWSPSALGPRDQVREALTPPALGLPADELWIRIRGGDLGSWWSDEVQAALAPTFEPDTDGLLRTRLGMDRHMAVLDGMLDHDHRSSLDSCEASGVPVWAAVCEPARARQGGDGLADAWQQAREDGVGYSVFKSN